MTISIKSKVNLKGKLTLGAAVDPADIPDDYTNLLDRSLAGQLTVDGGTLSGAYQEIARVDNEGTWYDPDVFKFTAVEDQLYTVIITLTGAGNVMNFTLYRPDDSVYSGGFGFGPGSSPASVIIDANTDNSGEVPIPGGGEWLIDLRAEEGCTYTIEVVSGANDVDDHGGTPATGTPVFLDINNPITYNGAFQYENSYVVGSNRFDDDWFRYDFNYAASGIQNFSWVTFHIVSSDGSLLTGEILDQNDVSVGTVTNDNDFYLFIPGGDTSFGSYATAADNGTWKVRVTCKNGTNSTNGQSYTVEVEERQDA